MTLNQIFDAHPNAKYRLLRAAVASLYAQGGNLRDFETSVCT